MRDSIFRTLLLVFFTMMIDEEYENTSPSLIQINTYISVTISSRRIDQYYINFLNNAREFQYDLFIFRQNLSNILIAEEEEFTNEYYEDKNLMIFTNSTNTFNYFLENSDFKKSVLIIPNSFLMLQPINTIRLFQIDHDSYKIITKLIKDNKVREIEIHHEITPNDEYPIYYYINSSAAMIIISIFLNIIFITRKYMVPAEGNKLDIHKCIIILNGFITFLSILAFSLSYVEKLVYFYSSAYYWKEFLINLSIQILANYLRNYILVIFFFLSKGYMTTTFKSQQFNIYKWSVLVTLLELFIEMITIVILDQKGFIVLDALNIAENAILFLILIYNCIKPIKILLSEMNISYNNNDILKMKFKSLIINIIAYAIYLGADFSMIIINNTTLKKYENYIMFTINNLLLMIVMVIFFNFHFRLKRLPEYYIYELNRNKSHKEIKKFEIKLNEDYINSENNFNPIEFDNKGESANCNYVVNGNIFIIINPFLYKSENKEKLYRHIQVGRIKFSSNNSINKNINNINNFKK